MPTDFLGTIIDAFPTIDHGEETYEHHHRGQARLAAISQRSPLTAVQKERAECPQNSSRRLALVYGWERGGYVHVGIDFGTSNSSVAVADAAGVRLLPLDDAARTPAVMPSLLYLQRNGQRLTGRRALQAYHDQNIGRSVQLRRVQVGVLQNTYAEVGAVSTDVFVWIDENEPGRLFQSLKTALRDATYHGTSVYGVGYSIEQLVAALLTDIRGRIERLGGGRVERAVFGRPVRYADDQADDALAEKRMRAACELAGFHDVQLLAEPVGAALSYEASVGRVRQVLVFDFGGGTLDVTVMAFDAQGGHQVLGTGGTSIGGDALDRRVMQRKLLPHFGVDVAVGEKRLALPARVADLLLSWQTIPQLNQPSNRAILDLIHDQRSGPAARRFRALDTLVSRNYGLPLFGAIEETKVRLSTEEDVRLQFAAEAIVLDEPITRREFEAMIAEEVRRAAACVDDTLAASGLRAEQIDDVVRTGGSSAIPIFVGMLAHRFGREKLREHRRFTGVAEGLAIAAAA